MNGDSPTVEEILSFPVDEFMGVDDLADPIASGEIVNGDIPVEEIFTFAAGDPTSRAEVLREIAVGRPPDLVRTIDWSQAGQVAQTVGSVIQSGVKIAGSIMDLVLGRNPSPESTTGVRTPARGSLLPAQLQSALPLLLIGGVLWVAMRKR